MTITEYDLFDNGDGENIIKRRKIAWHVPDRTGLDATRVRLQQLSQRCLRKESGGRYKEITAHFYFTEKE